MSSPEFIYHGGMVGPYWVTITLEWHPETGEDCLKGRLQLGEWEAIEPLYFPLESKLTYIRHRLAQQMYRQLNRWREDIGPFQRLGNFADGGPPAV